MRIRRPTTTAIRSHRCSAGLGGFDIAYKDVGVIGIDELVDFTITKLAFQSVTPPSQAWTNALGEVRRGQAGFLEDRGG